MEAYPLALAVDEAGRPDALGPNLAGLIAYVQHTLVLYHNLPDLPDRLRVQAHRNLSAVRPGPGACATGAPALRVPGSSAAGPPRSRGGAATDLERGAAKRVTREGVATGAPTTKPPTRGRAP